MIALLYRPVSTMHFAGASLRAQPNARNRAFVAVLIAATSYSTTGIVTSALAGATHSPQLRTVWRLVAWFVSLSIFVGHGVYEHSEGRSVGRNATHAAVAVGLAALVLAFAGPVRTHWGLPDSSRASLLSVVAWPLLTAAPAFLVTFAATSILRRMMSRPWPAIRRS